MTTLRIFWLVVFSIKVVGVLQKRTIKGQLMVRDRNLLFGRKYEKDIQKDVFT